MKSAAPLAEMATFALKEAARRGFSQPSCSRRIGNKRLDGLLQEVRKADGIDDLTHLPILGGKLQHRAKLDDAIRKSQIGQVSMGIRIISDVGHQYNRLRLRRESRLLWTD